MKCGFWSMSYCGVTPLNENEATLVGVIIFIRTFFNIIKYMTKIVLNLKRIILIVSSSFAKVHISYN